MITSIVESVSVILRVMYLVIATRRLRDCHEVTLVPKGAHTSRIHYLAEERPKFIVIYLAIMRWTIDRSHSRPMCTLGKAWFGLISALSLVTRRVFSAYR